MRRLKQSAGLPVSDCVAVNIKFIALAACRTASNKMNVTKLQTPILFSSLIYRFHLALFIYSLVPFRFAIVENFLWEIYNWAQAGRIITV